MAQKRILLAVTGELNYDQRMMRISTALHEAGYKVSLIGWKWKTSPELAQQPYQQVRLSVPFKQGKGLYFVYWVKLFFYLLFKKSDVICAIDLDTILPVYYASFIKGCKRVYDAHEIFTELQEVVEKPKMKAVWEGIAQFAIPRFPVGYTIGVEYAKYFKEHYKVNYYVVRNATRLRDITIPEKKKTFILYQGAVNVGRCFEYLIPAMQQVDTPLVIVGEGNFYEQAQELVKQYNVTDRVTFLGYKTPDELRKITLQAFVGITLFEVKGSSNLFSMANRFFDYMHCGVPQICNNYPEYSRVNDQYKIAVLVDDIQPDTIANALNELLRNRELHQELTQNTLKARQKYNWEQEEKTLLKVYDRLLN